MTRTAIPTFTTGQIVTAAFMNTYLKDNEAEHWSRISSLENNIIPLQRQDVAVVGRDSVQSIANNSEVILQWNVNSYITNPSMHSTSSNPDKIYAVNSGVHLVTLNGGFVPNGTGQRHLAIRLVGGSTLAFEGQLGLSIEGNFFSLAAMVYLTAGQYVYATAWQSSGAALDFRYEVSCYPSFAMHLLKG
jgi:hypothetical protein